MTKLSDIEISKSIETGKLIDDILFIDFFAN